MSETVELILDARSVLGESAIWDKEKQVLYWVDIDPGLRRIRRSRTTGPA